MWKKPSENLGQEYKDRLISFRKEPATVRIAKPTRIDRARSLGYKAKQGFLVIRQRVNRGGRKRENITGGRRPKANRQKKIVAKSYQQVAEERAVKNYTNCEVLNSYFVGKDGMNYWYEVIMVQRDHPNIKKDAQLRNIAKSRGRASRGLTSAGKKSRGLRNNKGKGAEKLRGKRASQR
jgi:large subunit ribosomal protein L15e